MNLDSKSLADRLREVKDAKVLVKTDFLTFDLGVDIDAVFELARFKGYDEQKILAMLTLIRETVGDIEFKLAVSVCLSFYCANSPVPVREKIEKCGKPSMVYKALKTLTIAISDKSNKGKFKVQAGAITLSRLAGLYPRQVWEIRQNRALFQGAWVICSKTFKKGSSGSVSASIEYADESFVPEVDQSVIFFPLSSTDGCMFIPKDDAATYTVWQKWHTKFERLAGARYNDAACQAKRPNTWHVKYPALVLLRIK